MDVKQQGENKMGKWISAVLGLVLLVGVAPPALAVGGNLTISDREIIERLRPGWKQG